MAFVRRYCLIVATAWAVTVPFAGPLQAQTNDIEAQDNKVIELYQAGKYAEAIPLAQQMLAMREKSLGPDHPGVAAALNNLASLYWKQGRYADAEPLFKRFREKMLGPGAPEVATGLNNLASLYKDQGRYADAEPLNMRALAIYKKTLGPDHPKFATALNNLASLYESQGRYADAEPLYKRSQAIREKALGPDHPDVAASLNNLAGLYINRGRYADAEPLYKRSLVIFEKALGPNHPYIALSLNNLALLYESQGRYADAEPIYERSLAIREKAPVPNYPDIALSLHNLASLYINQGRYADAEPLYKRALAIREKALGPYHPSVAMSLNNLALLYTNQVRFADAEPLYKRSLAIREKALGPDHPDVATALSNLAGLYNNQSRYADAEPLYKRALAIREKAFGPNHPYVAPSLNSMATLYRNQGRYAEALLLVRRTITNDTATTGVALPVLFGAQSGKLIRETEAFDDSLNVVQHATQTAAGQALNALAVRFSVGNDGLAELVRKDQDLATEADRLDKAVITAVSQEPAKRDAASEQRTKDRSAAVARERSDLQNVFAKEFPNYAALSKPQPLTTKEIKGLLADDEALVVIDLGNFKSYVWVVTSSAADWKELAVSADQVSKTVSGLRALLESAARPFDPKLSFALYRQVLEPVADIIRSKQRLSVVVNGALTSLPPQVLVTSDPAGKALKDVDWLIRRYSITILPSVASLKVLRGKTVAAETEAAKPLIGFADPVFDRNSLQQNTQVVANVTAERGLRGALADVAELAAALPALPETADELRRVAASLKAANTDVILGVDATETRVKQTKLDQYRIVYFATHGLLAGEVAEFDKLNAEPALVLSLPEKPTDFDDGLLTASEVAQLKLNADWVVLSACNTASGEKPGAEALSGLARAFFYAGGRSLLVSHWSVETNSAVALMTGTFAAIAADPRLSHGDALRKAMLAIIDDTKRPYLADPKFWAPFVVVGEPVKPGG
jgi:CHAT domain-containing protein/tetratricopeptide (TPR) repeat protein